MMTPCLDDRCAHRFAPLSEGRILNNATSSGLSCLQCSYHGWEFNNEGSCNRIPQASENAKSNKLCSLQSYPIQIAANMIFVWADPNTKPTSDEQPISNLLKRFDETGGTARGFQRDLPYGFELLGENLADISHLPFSHHSVGTLNRVDGRPVPLTMLTEAAKFDTAKLQNNEGKQLPLYQARVENAADHDPEIVAAFKYNPAVQAEADPKQATSTVSFYEPSHIRYHRNQGIPGSSYEIDLFMCPTTEGNSRVFLFTPFEKFLSRGPSASMNILSIIGNSTLWKEYRPSGLMQRSANKLNINKLFGRIKKPTAFPPHLGHMLAHQIFDGDGIFLNKQGDRMRRAGANYKDYNTPASADIVVNAFRRWLDKAAEVTRASGQESSASAALGDSLDTYKDCRPRSELLDRYASHTAKCGICQAALKSLNDKRDRISLLSTALIGATGASSMLFACTSIFLLVSRVLLRQSVSKGLAFKATLSVMFSSSVTIAASWIGVKKTIEKKLILDKEIQKFYFEDYVHAEKD